MAAYIFEAVQIESNDGTGYPVPYSNTAVGVQNGVFYLISGRPGIDGSKIITGDTARDLWYEGVLDSSLITCSRIADFIEAGCLASTSSLEFGVNNTGAFFNVLDANGIFISRCKVRYFWVTSEDLTTFNFEQRWQGVVDNQPFDEWTYKVQCVDNDKTLFHAVPLTTVDTAQFPTATKDSQGKMVPIMLGRVPYAKAQNVSGASTSVALIRVAINGTPTDLTVCAAYSHGPNHGYDPETGTVDLFTLGKTFAKDDYRLIGAFLNVIAGGNTQSRRIVSNTATSGSVTSVTLDEVLDTGIEFVCVTVLDTSVAQSADAWFFEVKAFSADLLISEKPIYQLNKNEHDSPCLFTFDESVNDYRDISDIQTKTDLSNINNENHPGFSVTAKTLDVNDAVSTYYKVRPGQIKFIDYNAIDTGASTIFPLLGKLVPNLNDVDDDTYYSAVAPPTNAQMILVFDIYLPPNITNKNWDDLCFLFDFSHSAQTRVPVWQPNHAYGVNSFVRPTVDNGFYYYTNPAGTSDSVEPTWPVVFNQTVVDNDITWTNKGVYPQVNEVNIQVSMWGLNIYGQINSTTIITDQNLEAAGFVVPITDTEKNFLPGVYFGEARNDARFYARKSLFNAASLLDTIKKSLAFNAVRFQIGITGNFGGVPLSAIPGFDYTMLLREIGIVGKRSVNFSTDSIFTSGKGEVFGTTWNDRRVPGNPILLIGDAFEHLFRNYDYPYPVWQPSTVYPTAAIIRPTADNGHFYISNPGGTSDTLEPTWPTPPGSGVVDNDITWNEFGEFKIDDDTFDDLASQRPNWFIGRSIVDKKDTSEYYKELAEQGFIGVQTDSDGRLCVKSWLDDQTSKVLFYEGNIVRDSLSGINSSPVRRVYNDLLVRYAYNPASGKFDKSIQVTNIDQVEFPGPTDLTNPGAFLGTFTIVKVAGHGGGWGIPTYIYQVTTDSSHGLVTGDLATLSGNTEGYNFTSVMVSVASATVFIVAVFNPQTVTAPTSTSGTLIKNATGTLAWQKFVSGIQNYALAKTLWTDCRSSYVTTKVIQKLPSELGDCFWFIDPAASDPDKHVFFPDVASSADEHPAVYLTRLLAAWTSRQKDQVTFLVPKDLLLADEVNTVLSLKLYECVTFQDQKLTAGDTKTAWIHELTDVPRSGETPALLRVGLTIKPDDLPDCTFLYDTPGSGTTLTDTPGAGTTVTDTPC